jgi:DNA-binding NtrC family response regulator
MGLVNRTRVLVVDDEPTIRRALDIALRRAGYEVLSAGSGEEAVALLRRERVDQLVVDLRIPDMRGDVVFELAASLQPHLRHATVFTTGDISDRAQELVALSGCTLLTKPFDLAELIATLHRLAPSVREATA